MTALLYYKMFLKNHDKLVSQLETEVATDRHKIHELEDETAELKARAMDYLRWRLRVDADGNHSLNAAQNNSRVVIPFDKNASNQLQSINSQSKEEFKKAS